MFTFIYIQKWMYTVLIPIHLDMNWSVTIIVKTEEEQIKILKLVISLERHAIEICIRTFHFECKSNNLSCQYAICQGNILIGQPSLKIATYSCNVLSFDGLQSLIRIYITTEYKMQRYPYTETVFIAEKPYCFEDLIVPISVTCIFLKNERHFSERIMLFAIIQSLITNIFSKYHEWVHLPLAIHWVSDEAI